MSKSSRRRTVVGLAAVGLSASLLGGARGGASGSGAALSYIMHRTDPPHDAPSVVLCRGQLFASSNFSAIQRIDPKELRILEVQEYPGVGDMHQITTDGQMLYAAYFTESCETSTSPTCTARPTHGILKVDPANLSVVARLPLEPDGVLGWPEGFVWHDGYLYEAAYGFRGASECRIPKIEPASMTFVGTVALPNMEGCHGITYDGESLYALGVPPVTSTYYPDHVYKIDPDSLEIKATLTLPQGLHHYGGNVYLARNGFLYTSPGFPEETRGALVRIDPRSFTVVDVLQGGGRHWLATEGRYIYLIEGEAVRAIDPDAMVTLGRSSPPFDPGVSTLHYGYVGEDGGLYLGFENAGGRGQVARMVTLAAADRTAPSALGPIKNFASEGVVRLGWGTAEDPESGVLAYRVYRGLLASAPQHLATLPGSSLRFSDRSAEAGKTYVYEVAAVNGAGMEGARQSTAPVANLAQRVQQGNPFEITLESDALPGDAWVEAVFVSPSGRKVKLTGQYARPGAWKVRFTPNETGPWRFAVSSSETTMVKFGGFEVAGRGSSRRPPRQN